MCIPPQDMPPIWRYHDHISDVDIPLYPSIVDTSRTVTQKRPSQTIPRSLSATRSSSARPIPATVGGAPVRCKVGAKKSNIWGI